MTVSRRKIMGAVASAGLLLAGTVQAEVKINDQLKVDGFVDMSASYKKADAGDTKTISLDQVQLDTTYAPTANLSAYLDVNDNVSANDKGAVVGK